MSDKRIYCDVRDNVAHCILNAPPKNEMDEKFFLEFADLASDLSSRNVLDGVIIYGVGRHFSSGAKLKDLFERVATMETDSIVDHFSKAASNFSKLESLMFPTVAAISGCCLGSGLELALCCKFRVATQAAVFALPEVQFGIIPGCGGTVRLPELIGQGRAMEMILTGRMVGAEEALGIGLVDRIVTRDELIDVAREMIIA